MQTIPPKAVNPDGLHQRYEVQKADGSPVHPLAVYFVLRLDIHGDDKCHTRGCRAAAKAYAEAVHEMNMKGEAHNLTKMARELRTLAEEWEMRDK